MKIYQQNIRNYLDLSLLEIGDIIITNEHWNLDNFIFIVGFINNNNEDEIYMDINDRIKILTQFGNIITLYDDFSWGLYHSHISKMSRRKKF